MICEKTEVISIIMGEMMKLSREEIITALKEWNHAWENHDLEGVMKLYHDDKFF